MTAQDTMALLAVCVLLVVLIGVVGDIYKRRLRFKERELELFSKRTAEKAAQYAAQAERLEQRVRVLERIATDKGAHLAERIGDLQDPAVN